MFYFDYSSLFTLSISLSKKKKKSIQAIELQCKIITLAHITIREMFYAGCYKSITILFFYILFW